MFVSVILDPGGIDSARSLVNVLINNGFKKIQRACWESMSVSEADITTLFKFEIFEILRFNFINRENI